MKAVEEPLYNAIQEGITEIDDDTEDQETENL